MPKSIAHFQLAEPLGRGAFATVYKAFDTETGAIVAIKAIELERVSDQESNRIMTEVNILKRLKHPNIIRYVGYIRSRKRLYVVLEYCEGSSLETLYLKFGGFSEKLTKRYVLQVLEGLDFLHSQGITHRDVKASNILSTKQGLVKLADFGIAGEVTGDEESENESVGSPYWIAPEVINKIAELESSPSDKFVGPPSDIWSLACTVIEVLQAKPPRGDLTPVQAIHALYDNPIPDLPSNITDPCRHFLRKCLRKNPMKRPSALELLSHSWFAEYHSLPPTSSGLPRAVKQDANTSMDDALIRRGSTPSDPMPPAMLRRAKTDMLRVEEDLDEMSQMLCDTNLNRVLTEAAEEARRRGSIVRTTSSGNANTSTEVPSDMSHEPGSDMSGETFGDRPRSKTSHSLAVCTASPTQIPSKYGEDSDMGDFSDLSWHVEDEGFLEKLASYEAQSSSQSSRPATADAIRISPHSSEAQHNSIDLTEIRERLMHSDSFVEEDEEDDNGGDLYYAPVLSPTSMGKDGRMMTAFAKRFPRKQ